MTKPKSLRSLRGMKRSKPRRSSADSVFNGDLTLRYDSNIATLNNAGLKQLEEGKECDAAANFTRALLVAYGQDVHLMDEKKKKTWRSKLKRIFKKKYRQTAIEEPPATNSLREQQQEQRKELYIYQRDDYDEGMHAFTDPIEIDTNCKNHNVIAATVMYNLALIHAQNKRYSAALCWFEHAHKLSEGETSMNRGLLEHHLGHINYRLGKYQQALVHYQSSMDAAHDSGWSEDQQAKTMNCVAVIQFHIHSNDAMLEKCKETLTSALQKVNNKEDPYAATILNNLGRIHYSKNEFQEALELYREALEIRERLLGPTHIDVAVTKYNIGQTLHQTDKLEEAMEHYGQFLAIAKPRLGKDHRDIAVVYKFMAQIHQAFGRYDDGMELFNKALVIGRKALGNNNPEVASMLNKMGNLCYTMDDLDNALSLYQEGLEVELQVLEQDHEHVLVTYSNIAQIYKQREEYDMAMQTLQKLHDAQLRKSGQGVDVAHTYTQMAWIQFKVLRYDAAFDYYQKALQIRRDFHGDDHMDVTASLKQIGVVLFKQKAYEAAIDALYEALRIRIKLLGRDDVEVAVLWYSLGSIYLEMGSETKAIHYYKETLRIQRLALGEEHEDTIRTVRNIGLVHSDRGEYEIALEYMEEALLMERQPSHGRYLTYIASIHLRRGHASGFVEYMSRAARMYRESGRGDDILDMTGFNMYELAKLHPECAATA